MNPDQLDSYRIYTFNQSLFRYDKTIQDTTAQLRADGVISSALEREINTGNLCDGLTLQWIAWKLTDSIVGESGGQAARKNKLKNRGALNAAIDAHVWFSKNEGRARSNFQDQPQYWSRSLHFRQSLISYPAAYYQESETKPPPFSQFVREIKSVKGAAAQLHIPVHVPNAPEQFRGNHALACYCSHGNHVTIFDPNFGEFYIEKSKLSEWLSCFLGDRYHIHGLPDQAIFGWKIYRWFYQQAVQGQGRSKVYGRESA